MISFLPKAFLLRNKIEKHFSMQEVLQHFWKPTQGYSLSECLSNMFEHKTPLQIIQQKLDEVFSYIRTN